MDYSTSADAQARMSSMDLVTSSWSSHILNLLLRRK